MNIKEALQSLIRQALETLDYQVEEILLEHPADMTHGDYATNVALVLAKKTGKQPREIAEEITQKIGESLPEEVEKTEIAGPGFINFYLSSKFFSKALETILKQGDSFGMNQTFSGQRIMVEYTQPNPFKVFHIGHLMSNAIGESIARLHEYGGAQVIRANYQGDIGLHVAKAMWGILQTKENFPQDKAPLSEKTAYLGAAYVSGAEAYESNETNKEEINKLNRVIFEGHDEEIKHFYKKGREWSLEHFEEIYEKLGTAFVHYFFESQAAEPGIAIVEEQLDKGVFKESEGAIIFDGEPYGLHKRVFINSLGLPTYETKEIGLTRLKFEAEPELTKSIVVTAEEQKEYMRVVLKAIEQFWPEATEKTTHITHGMMRFADSKMSSRTGNVISGESLLTELEELALAKINESEHELPDKEKLATQVAVAGIKFSVLRQATGKNIVFDREKSLSFEGDSGPYLQYTYARIQSLSRKAIEEKIEPTALSTKMSTSSLEKLLYRFPEVIELALREYAPHHVVNYIVELAREFNSWYGTTKIVDAADETSGYNVALTIATGAIIGSGLHVLGIQGPEKM